jgi:hypothetical protein
MTTASSDDGVTVVFETIATEDEIRAVKDALAESGLRWPITTDAEPEPRGGPGEIALLLTFVAAYGFKRFFDAFIDDAGKSASQGFSEFLARLRARRRPQRCEIRIRDEAGHTITMNDDPPAQVLAALEALDFQLAWDFRTAEVGGSDVPSADALRQKRYRITWSKRGERGREEPLTVVARLFRAEMDLVAFYNGDGGQWDSPVLLIKTSDMREVRELRDDN